MPVHLSVYAVAKTASAYGAAMAAVMTGAGATGDNCCSRGSRDNWSSGGSRETFGQQRYATKKSVTCIVMCLGPISGLLVMGRGRTCTEALSFDFQRHQCQPLVQKKEKHSMCIFR